MSKKSKIFLCLLIFSIILAPSPVLAAKKFVKKTTSSVKRTTGSSLVIPASVRYRPDKLGILLSFKNFTNLSSVSYSFTYDTNGMSQGAGGTITAANNPTAQRELLFGTCSGGVCRYHDNLSNARLVLTAKYNNGKTAIKSYKIKTYR